VQAILDEAGMTLQDIIKVTSYIVGQENISAYVEAHKAVLGELKPPWTLVVVQALGAPQYLIEVDVTAAR
jgi:enamine deaminase RidA (YjgF/YER057c/UK114 family)